MAKEPSFCNPGSSGDGEPGSGAGFQRHTTSDLVKARPSDEERERTRLPVVVVLENVRSAYNVGLVFRLCDCVNVSELILTGITPYPGVSRHATNRIAKTGVGGSLEVLPWRHVDDAAAELRRLKQEGWRVVVLEQGSGSVHWRDAELAAPLALVFGHERDGVTDEIITLADEIAELPVRGITNSLNVALCAAAVLYEALERMAPTGGASC